MKSCAWLLGVSLISFAHGGQLVTYSKNGTVTSAYAVQQLKTLKDPFALPTTSPAIDVYRVKYRSRGLNGKPVILSGMVALPKGGAPKGTVIFYHGTTSDPTYVPSRYNCTDSPEEVQHATIDFCSGGYAVFAPDYLGLGDGPGFHPYPLGSINCWSGIDMIEAGRALAAKLNFSIGEHLFVTGYSEGGAVAMWAIRMLDHSTQYSLTAGAPLSGPYDLSGSQMKLLLSNQSSPLNLAAIIFFGSYFAISIQKNFPEYDINLADYFAPSFASYVPIVFGRKYNDDQRAKALAVKALQEGALRSMKTLLTKSFLTAVKAVDPSDPLVGQTLANNCYDWSPKTPTYLVHLFNDTMVAPANSTVALTTMRARGVGSDILKSYTITQKGLTHITAAAPATALARRFFDSGFSGVPDDGS